MTLTVRSATVSGATTKGSPLTHAEMDANWAHVIQSSNHNFTPSGSGAVSRDTQSHLRELVVNAKGFGTKFATTPAADVNLAITAVNAAGGGTVLIPESFTAETAITLKSNVVLRGSGRGTVITSSSNAGVIQGSTVSNAVVRDLAILGSSGGASQAGITLTGATGCLIHNVYVKDVGHDGILLITDCVGNTVSDCHVDGAGDDGINIGGGSGTSDNTVVGNVVENCAEDGIHISLDSKRTTVTGNVIIACDDGIGIVDAESASIFANTIYNCDTTGIICAAVNDSPYMTIMGNTISTCPIGISLLRCIHASVTGNNISAATTNAILLFTNNDHYDVDQVISGNTIDGGCSTAAINVNGSKNVTITANSISDVTGAGILTNSATSNGCSNLVISNNVIRDPDGAGIQVGDGTNSEHISILGNIIDTAGTRGIYYLGGTYFTIANNRCVDCTERGIYVNGTAAKNGRGFVEGNTIEGGCSTAGIAFLNYSDVVCDKNTIYGITATTAIRIHSGNVLIGKSNLYEDIVEGDQGTLESRLVEFKDDFLGDVLADQWGSQVGTDQEVVAPAILAGQQRGVVRMTTGDDATGDMATNGVQLELGLHWRANQGGLSCEFRLSANAVTNLVMFVGLTDQVGTRQMPFTISGTTLTSNASNAVGVLFDTDATTDNWKLVGVSGDTDATVQDAGVAPAGGTFETWRIEITASGVATFFRNGAQIGTAMTGAVGTNVSLTPVLAAFSRSNASRNIDCDLIRVQSAR